MTDGVRSAGRVRNQCADDVVRVLGEQVPVMFILSQQVLVWGLGVFCGVANDFGIALIANGSTNGCPGYYPLSA